MENEYENLFSQQKYMSTGKTRISGVSELKEICGISKTGYA